MVIDSLVGLKTDQGILDAVRSASKTLSAGELQEQRVSFAFGSLRPDSNMTKDQVRRVIVAQNGVVSNK